MAEQRKDQAPGAPRRPQPYPPSRADDAIERTAGAEEAAGEGRSFENAHDRLGPAGDPAEGKR